MSSLLDQMPSLKNLIDFDGLTKSTSVYKLQGRLLFLLEETSRELADYKVNARNPDLAEEAILKYAQEAQPYSNGDLRTVKPMILRIFGYSAFNLHTELDVEKKAIRQLLLWSPD